MKNTPIPTIGRKFGRLTVRKTGLRRSGHTASLCECDCGKTILVADALLWNGRRVSCGCLRREAIENAKPKVGTRYGRLTIVSNNITKMRGGKKRNACLCKCDCGREVVVFSNSIKSGNTTSCGCYHNEAIARLTYKHGLSKSRLFNIWNNMKSRCYNTSNKRYSSYGGRGISICEEWRGDFKAFHDWALSNGYSPDKSIDRIDPNGNYEPDNCRWATMLEQAGNKRSTIYLTVKGVTKKLTQWAKELSLSQPMLRDRRKSGWSDEECILPKGSSRLPSKTAK